MPPTTTFRRAIGVVIAVFVGLLAGPPSASAHTEFDFSLPTDGASVGDPVDEFTIASPVTVPTDTPAPTEATPDTEVEDAAEVEALAVDADAGDGFDWTLFAVVATAVIMGLAGFMLVRSRTSGA